MKNLVILGATGSIGTQTLDVVQSFPEWNVLAITANTSINLLYQQIKKFNPCYAVIKNEKSARKLKKMVKKENVEIITGIEGLEHVASLKEADLVINALVGAVGLKPTISALKAQNTLGLANKESLVIGGEFIDKTFEEENINILPVDSEHSAIFNLICNQKQREIKNLWLTASGGPFYDLPKNEFENVTVEQALDHPNWDMGPKITIDSATLMNKGLEVIEAHWLFDKSYDKIKVIIHQESLIHSLVEFIDDTFRAEIGPSDMQIPIQNVLTFPEMKSGHGEKLNLYNLQKLTFKKPDMDKFKLLKLAYYAGKKGGSVPIILNAANEIVVNSFLEKRISFAQIPEIINNILQKDMKIKNISLEKIFEIDNWAREKAREVIENADNYN